MRLLLAATLFVGLAAAGRPAATQEAPALADVKLNLDALQTWGTRTYGLFGESATLAKDPDGTAALAPRATLTLTTQVESGSVVLTDQLQGSGRAMTCTYRCGRDNFLSLRAADLTAAGGPKPLAAAVTVAGGKAIVETDGKRQEVDFPAGTLTLSAFYRVVTLLPREKGSAVTFAHSAETPDLRVRTPPVGSESVECLGPEALKSGGRDVPCTKFTTTIGRGYLAWVSADGVLQRVEDRAGTSVLVRTPGAAKK